MRKHVWSVRDITKIALVCAMYVALTLVLAPLSFGSIQFRFAEVLILLCFFDRRYGVAITLGCLIANCFSPLGWVDVVFGTLSTLLPVLIMTRMKRLESTLIWPIVGVALIVGAELSIVYHLPFWITVLQVGIGEAVVIVLIGYPLMKGLAKMPWFKQTIAHETHVVESKVSLGWIPLAFFGILSVLAFTLPLYEDHTWFDLMKTEPVYLLLYVTSLLAVIFSLGKGCGYLCGAAFLTFIARIVMGVHLLDHLDQISLSNLIVLMTLYEGTLFLYLGLLIFTQPETK